MSQTILQSFRPIFAFGKNRCELDNATQDDILMVSTQQPLIPKTSWRGPTRANLPTAALGTPLVGASHIGEYPMPHKDREVAKVAARERKRRWRLMHRPPGWVDGRGRHPGLRGALSPQWTGGHCFHESGYLKVRVGKGHPAADPNGYAYEHHLVWLSAGNPPLRAAECLHHINGVHTDNRIENLQLTTHSVHMAHHARIRIPERRVLLDIPQDERDKIVADWLGGVIQDDLAKLHRTSRWVISEIRRLAGLIKHQKRSDPAEFPEDLRVRETPKKGGTL